MFGKKLVAKQPAQLNVLHRTSGCATSPFRCGFSPISVWNLVGDPGYLSLSDLSYRRRNDGDICSHPQMTNSLYPNLRWRRHRVVELTDESIRAMAPTFQNRGQKLADGWRMVLYYPHFHLIKRQNAYVVPPFSSLYPSLSPYLNQFSAIMAPTILVAGATGNTGRGVVETLSKLLNASNTNLSGYRVIALTRSLRNPVAQHFATLPGVVVLEQNWVEITADWLRQHEVVRAFIASHNEPNQFAEESTFHIAALRAGVQYVVRISTTAANVRPDCDAYYPRTHWAIEAMLSSPEFGALQWTSLQPNIFANFYLAPAAALIKQYRKTGKQETLRLMASSDAPVGVVEAGEVGVFAAHLLCQEDPSLHNKASYVLNGPQDITGEQIVKMVEQHIGTRVESVIYKDCSVIEQMAAASQESRNVILSIMHAPESAWEGKCSTTTTSKEVLEIAAPTRTPADALKALLEE